MLLLCLICFLILILICICLYMYANFYLCVSVILLVVNKRKGGLRVGDNMSSETELMMSLGERGLGG